MLLLVAQRAAAFGRASAGLRSGINNGHLRRGLCTGNSPSSLSSLLSFPQRHPFPFQVGVATVKTSAADFLAQTVVEQKRLHEVDLKRNLLFVLFGAGYLGCFQGLLMVNLYGRWFPTMHKVSRLDTNADRYDSLSPHQFAAMPVREKLAYTAGLLDMGKMVLFDICVHLPFIYFPCFYVSKVCSAICFPRGIQSHMSTRCAGVHIRPFMVGN